MPMYALLQHVADPIMYDLVCFMDNVVIVEHNSNVIGFNSWDIVTGCLGMPTSLVSFLSHVHMSCIYALSYVSKNSYE